jgi:hypothetical protein
MPLEKLTIINLDKNESFEVLFNPTEYTIEKRTPWREHEVPGLDMPAVEFVSGERGSLSMDLFMDTSDEGTDVREHVSKIGNLMFVDPELHRPPVLLVTWGTLSWPCVLEHGIARYTMFLPDGTPVRAVFSGTFRRHTPTEEQLQNAPRESADHTKRRIVREGDTLQLIAAKEYKDAGQWRRIAAANRIEDPLLLSPGQELVIPPLA